MGGSREAKVLVDLGRGGGCDAENLGCVFELYTKSEGTNELILYRGIILNPFSFTRCHLEKNDMQVAVHEG